VPVHVVDHPIVQDILLKLRDAQTGPDTFRAMARRVSLLVAAEATRDLPTRPASVTTPLAVANGRELADDVVVVPVLRAGLGMLEAVLEVVPEHPAARHLSSSPFMACAVRARIGTAMPCWRSSAVAA
jgi:uracil phosphoribosyltransferase